MRSFGRPRGLGARASLRQVADGRRRLPPGSTPRRGTARILAGRGGRGTTAEGRGGGAEDGGGRRLDCGGVVSREAMLELLLSMGREIRGAVVAACAAQRTEQLSAVVRDDEGDTIYAIDSVSEQIVVARVEAAAAALGGVVLVAEGLRGGQL